MEQSQAKTGRSAGGVARAAKLSAEERSAIAAKGAKARWADRPEPNAFPKVLEGYSNVLELAGTRIPCAVIDGPKGVQRVLTETGISDAILGGRSGASKRISDEAKRAQTEGSSPSDSRAQLPVFLASTRLNPFISNELWEGPFAPVDYLDGTNVVRGYDASVLVAVCNIWLRAREAGALRKDQLGRAQKAEILTRALAETGIVALIDEATGYQLVRPQNALQAYLEVVIRKELAAWAKKFPDEFYENIYKIRGWKWTGMSKNRYSAVAHYTKDLVYSRLGIGVLEELLAKSPRNENGSRPNRLHQWLSEDIGNPMLAQHLHAIMMFQRLAIANGYTWKRFVLMVDQVLPRKGDTRELPLNFTDDES